MDKIKVRLNVLGGASLVSPTGRHMLLADDDIPNLISALQDYMSRRATERTHAALRAFPPVTDEDDED